MRNEHLPLTAYSEEQRQAAMVKYRLNGISKIKKINKFNRFYLNEE